MKHAIIRWSFYMAALLVVGPLAGLMTGSVHGSDGGPAATALISGNLISGVLAMVGSLLLATVFGASAGMAGGFRAGMTSAGIVVAWAAWRTASLDDLLRTPGAGPVLWKLAAEGLLAGSAGVGLAWVVWRLAPKPGAEASQATPRPDVSPARFLACAPVAVVVGGAVAAVIAFSDLKGQTIAAATIGAIFGTAATRLLVTSPMEFLPMVSVAILAFASPAVGAAWHGSDLTEAVYDGSVLGFVRPLPLDWVAGGLLGVPVGLSWGASLAAKHKRR